MEVKPCLKINAFTNKDEVTGICTMRVNFVDKLIKRNP
jgi:hypothetical protein